MSGRRERVVDFQIPKAAFNDEHAPVLGNREREPFVEFAVSPGETYTWKLNYRYLKSGD